MEGLLEAPVAAPSGTRSRTELIARLHFVFGGGVQIAAAYARAEDFAAFESLCGDLARSLGLGFTATSVSDWIAYAPARATLPVSRSGRATVEGATWRHATVLAVSAADEPSLALAAAKLRAESAVRRHQCVLLACRGAYVLSPELHDLAGMAFSVRGLS